MSKFVWVVLASLSLAVTLGWVVIIVYYYNEIMFSLGETLLRFAGLFIGCFCFTLGITEALRCE